MNIRYPIYEGVYRILTSEKGKKNIMIKIMSREKKFYRVTIISSKISLSHTGLARAASWRLVTL